MPGSLDLRYRRGTARVGFVDFALCAYHFQNAHWRGGAIPWYTRWRGVAGLSELGGRCSIATDSHNRLAIAVALFASTARFLGGPVDECLLSLLATGLGAQNSILRSGIEQVISMTNGHRYGASMRFRVMWLRAGSDGNSYDYRSPRCCSGCAQLIAAVMFLCCTASDRGSHARCAG